MRLTKDDKSAFVMAVMADLPEVDYNEQVRKIVTDYFVARLPEAVSRVYETAPEWVNTLHVSTPGHCPTAYAPILDPSYNTQHDHPELWSTLVGISAQISAQHTVRRELQQQIRSAIEGCTTLKKAKEVLPEFEKYLPADRDSIINRSMPVISNLIVTLTEAGWPKDHPLAQGASA